MIQPGASTAARIHVEFAEQPIDPLPLRGLLADADTGAHAWFEGVTRRTTGGAVTERLSYQAFVPMATAQLRGLAQQAATRFDLRAVVIVHRLGSVPVGEASILIGCCSPHRGGALAALPWLMDKIKTDVAIWKQEHFADGQSQWVHPQ
jgi:molybdopterin synthase catalytic subunit